MSAASAWHIRLQDEELEQSSSSALVTASIAKGPLSIYSDALEEKKLNT